MAGSASSKVIGYLDKGKVLPERKSERLYWLLKDEERVLIDATERGFGRSVDYETQKDIIQVKKLYLKKCTTGWP